MTQIQHVTAKEMTRRTGVRNALGYTFPEKDLILLRKGLTGKLKREVLDHEMDHLEKGEEGPFSLGSLTEPLIGAGASLLGGALGAKGAEAGADVQRGMYEQTQRYLEPYREFGGGQLESLRNWLAGPTGAFAPVSVEDVMASPEYQAGLRTMESSAAARGGLKSGNFLRRISEELAPMGIERERQRRMQDLQARLGLVDIGRMAAGGGAQAATAFAPGMAAGAAAPYQAWRGVAGDIAGLAGQYQQQKQWQDFLSQYNAPSTPYAAGSVPAGYQVGPVR